MLLLSSSPVPKLLKFKLEKELIILKVCCLHHHCTLLSFLNCKVSTGYRPVQCLETFCPTMQFIISTMRNYFVSLCTVAFALQIVYVVLKNRKTNKLL